MFLHFLAGLLLTRTFLATPGPTQRWTSLTAFPVVCVCVCVFFFFCGGGGELCYICKWLHFFMMQPRGRPTDHCEYRTTCTVPRTFQGCGILHSHNNLPRHTRLFTGKEKEAALADKTLRRAACKGDQWNAS